MFEDFDCTIDGHQFHVDYDFTEDACTYNVEWITVPDETYPGGYTSMSPGGLCPEKESMFYKEAIIGKTKDWLDQVMEDRD